MISSDPSPKPRTTLESNPPQGYSSQTGMPEYSNYSSYNTAEYSSYSSYNTEMPTKMNSHNTNDAVQSTIKPQGKDYEVLGMATTRSAAKNVPNDGMLHIGSGLSNDKTVWVHIKRNNGTFDDIRIDPKDKPNWVKNHTGKDANEWNALKRENKSTPSVTPDRLDQLKAEAKETYSFLDPNDYISFDAMAKTDFNPAGGGFEHLSSKNKAPQKVSKLEPKVNNPKAENPAAEPEVNNPKAENPAAEPEVNNPKAETEVNKPNAEPEVNKPNTNTILEEPKPVIDTKYEVESFEDRLGAFTNELHSEVPQPVAIHLLTKVVKGDRWVVDAPWGKVVQVSTRLYAVYSIGANCVQLFTSTAIYRWLFEDRFVEIVHGSIDGIPVEDIFED
jgi:hypothetical protein